MATNWNRPALPNLIAEDIPAINDLLVALAKLDPSLFANPAPAMFRLNEVSPDKYQWQRYNGTDWQPITGIQVDARDLVGYPPSVSAKKATLVLRNQDGKLVGDLVGNADTASSAATLSQTLEVAKGGTGATTSAEARRNIGAAPVSHASTGTDYGMASNTNYGHVKLSDAHDSTSGQTAGVAATPAAVKKAYDDGTRTASSSMQGQVRASTTALEGAVPIMNAEGHLDKSIVPTHKPIGSFFLWPYETPPDGALVCNGQTVSRTLYKDLWDHILHKNLPIYGDSVWQSEASRRNGYFSAFSNGDGSTTFRLPKFAPYVKVTNTPSEAGQYFEAGLPNITGRFEAYGDKNHASPVSYIGSGSFIAIDENAPYLSGTLASANDYHSIGFDFDASDSDPTYGKSNTVQPESMNWIVCVQAFGTASNIGNVDVANVVNALNDKVNTDLSNAPNIATKTFVENSIIEGAFTLPVGMIFTSVGTSYSGALLCNGAAVSKTTYLNLYNFAKGKPWCKETESTFTLPDMRGLVLQTAGGGGIELGKKKEAGLPNITGNLRYAHGGWANPVGALYVRAGRQYPGGDYKNEGTYNGTGVALDASLANSLYGSSSTVQPPAFGVNVFIIY